MFKKLISFFIVFAIAISCMMGCSPVDPAPENEENFGKVTLKLELLDEMDIDFVVHIGSFDNATVNLVKEKDYTETIDLPFGEHYVHDIKAINSEESKFLFEAVDFVVSESDETMEVVIKVSPIPEDETEPSTEGSEPSTEVTDPVENETTPSEPEANDKETDEGEPTKPVEKPTEPPKQDESSSADNVKDEVNKPTEEPTKPTEPEVKFTEVDETVYAISSVNVRTGPGTNYEKIGGLKYRDSVKRIGIGDNGWSKVIYNDKEAYVHSDYLSTTQPAEVNTTNYPLTWSDSTAKITITKEWFENAWCYIAHLEFSDYGRLGTNCGNGSYGGGTETTSHAAKRLGAIFAVNGCYSSPNLGYIVVRDGKIWNGADRNTWLPAVYSQHNGLLLSAWESGGDSSVAGKNVQQLVNDGLFTDSFCFGPPILTNGNYGNADTSRAQRTFIGTNGNAGDIWVVVSDGRYNDGESAGLTYSQCAKLLVEKGCTFGVPLDGGGSSTMYFNGKVLNAANGNQRAVVDFLYFK